MPFDRSSLKKPVKTRRLSMRRLKTGWAIVSDKPVGVVTVPVHHELPKVDRDTAVTGTWIELFDEHRRVLYRRRVDLPDTVEAHGTKNDSARTGLPDPLRSELTVLIPDLPETVGIALFESHPVSTKRGLVRPRADLVPVAVFARRTRSTPPGRRTGFLGADQPASPKRRS